MSEFYVDNKKFYEEIVEYKKAFYETEAVGDPTPPIPEYCGQCILNIANGFAMRPQFNGYSFKEEMIGDAIENCIQYFNRFDETKYKNPHAYYTQICYYAFIGRINEEEKKRYGKYKMFSNVLSGVDVDNMMTDENGPLINEPVYDNISEFIERFEAKEEAKRVKKKERLAAKKAESELDKLLVDEENDTGTVDS